MNSEDLLKKKAVLFNKYKQFSLQQQTALLANDLERVEMLAEEKEKTAKEIQKLDMPLLNEKADQHSLEPIIREILILEDSMTADLEKQKTGLIAESSILHKGRQAIRQYLEK